MWPFHKHEWKKIGQIQLVPIIQKDGQGVSHTLIAVRCQSCLTTKQEHYLGYLPTRFGGSITEWWENNRNG